MADMSVDRITGALVGLFIADALAMPTHWFYGGPSQVRQLYGGPITGYVAPVTHLPGSILSKSNTGGGGRGGFQGDIIGNIIFHGKKQFWKPGADYHYHQSMRSGDNTLEALLVRRALTVTTQEGHFNEEKIRADYIKFMTTPDSHNDTYCGTCHRMFFAKLANGVPPVDCPDNDGHNVDTSDALVTTIPIALAAKDDNQALGDVANMVAITRNSRMSQSYAQKFSKLLRKIVEGTPLKQAIEEAAKDIKYDIVNSVKRERSDPITACYLDSSYAATLFMAYKYSDPSGAKFESGVLANANRGGENVGTGALIGALLGAECGFSQIPKHLVDGLAEKDEILREVNAFVAQIRK